MERLLSELSKLLERHREVFDGALSLRSATARINGCASVVKSVLKDSSIYPYEVGMYVYYNGRCYELVSEAKLLGLLQDWLEESGLGYSEASRIATRSRLATLCTKEFCEERWKLCFTDCVYDLSSGAVLRFSAKHHTIESFPYAYGSEAGCPRWLSFLERVIPEVEERMCLQELMGMPFIDRRRLSVEKLAVFVGSGANGKSVVNAVWRAVIGEDRVGTLTPRDLRNKDMVPSLIGKRLNFSPDVEVSGSIFASELKALASGQSVTGWVLYEGAVEVECPPLVFSMNRMPIIRDDSEGMWRRIMIFPFPVTIPASEQDLTLADGIIRDEISGVMRWCLEGRERLVSSGGVFTHSKAMEAALNRLRSGADASHYPVLGYLRRKGYDVMPQYPGQMYDLISQVEIRMAFANRLTPTVISREVLALGGKSMRRKEGMYYKVYELDKR